MGNKVELNKSVFNKDKFKNTINTNFSEFINTGDSISVSTFFNYYNTLFYDIPVEGDESHSTLIQRSSDYVGVEENEELLRLRDRVLELELEIVELEASNSEHPVFKNGTILKDPVIKGRYWYMDRGVKRLIIGNEVLVTIIRSQDKTLNKTRDGDIKIDNYVQNVPDIIISQIETGPSFGVNDFSGKLRDTSKNLNSITQQTQQVKESIAGVNQQRETL